MQKQRKVQNIKKAGIPRRQKDCDFVLRTGTLLPPIEIPCFLRFRVGVLKNEK